MKNIVLLMLIAMTGLSFTGTETSGLKVGDEAPDFSLKNIDGKMVSLADMKDAKGFLVIFTCNHCPYSKAYEDRIIALDKKYKSKGYPVVAINPNDPAQYEEDSFENMQKRAKDKGFTFPYLFDETQNTAKAYGASRTPHVYLLQKDNGKLIVRYIGAIDNDTEENNPDRTNFAANAVDALLSGSTPNPDFTKAIGCSVKWKN